MKKGMMRKVAWSLMLVVMLAVLLVPALTVMAESFGTNSTVLVDAGYTIGDTYQRHSFNAVGYDWVFYATDDAIYYTCAADAETWAVPTKFDDYLCDMTPEDCCNGSSFSLWYDTALNYVDVAWMNVTGENEPIYYRMGRPQSNGTITWYPSFVAVEAVADLTYSHPSICDNTLDYPFIAYMVYNSSSSGYSGSVSADTENTGHWTSATNSTINSETSLNISLDVLYPSVVPVNGGNVSIQVVFDSGADYLLAQNYLQYNVSEDQWYYPETAQFPLPASTSIDVADLPYHSEVVWLGNISEPDCVYMIATANDTLLGKILWYDKSGTALAPWTDDAALDTGYYVGALGIRNALGDMSVTAIEMTQKTHLYNWEYDMTAGSWSSANAIDGVDATSSAGAETDYDNAGTDYLGALYYDNTVAFVPDMEYGCYGCSSPSPASTDPGTTVMQIIIPLLVAITVLLLGLKGIGEVNTINAIIILMVATIIGVITFFVIKTLVLGL